MASRLQVAASSVALKLLAMGLKSGYRQQLVELGAEQKRLVTLCKKRQKRSARLGDGIQAENIQQALL